jgi:hypothetical protein
VAQREGADWGGIVAVIGFFAPYSEGSPTGNREELLRPFNILLREKSASADTQVAVVKFVARGRTDF